MLCLQNGESKQRFVHLANSQQYFSFEGHADDLKSRVNSWWLLVLQFLSTFTWSLRSAGSMQPSDTVLQHQEKCPAPKMKPHFTERLRDLYRPRL